jgi:predicted DNA-binding protein with PD1-like motif
MTFQKINNQVFLIRLNRGEKIIACLKNFCIKNKIYGGFFYGIGAVDEVELAHYDVSQKKYSSEKFNLPLELTSLLGNVGFFKKELIIHAHATLANKKMQSFGGHLVEGKISGTGEIFFTKTKKLNKILDGETGLKVFSFKNQI